MIGKIILTLEILGFILILVGVIREQSNKHNKQYPDWDTMTYTYYPRVREINHRVSWFGFWVMVLGVLVAIWS